MTYLIAALATWQIIEIWRHSTLFSSARATVELWPGKLGELLMCPWCLSVYCACFCLFVLSLPTDWTVSWLHPWLNFIPWFLWLGTAFAKLVIGAFAVSRLANLANDYFHDYSRTPRFTVNPAAFENKEQDESATTTTSTNDVRQEVGRDLQDGSEQRVPDSA
jgi:hypothetical protein